jgi:phage shock protein C
MQKKLYRSKKNEKICGVCAGIAEFFNIDPTIVRLIWAVAVLCAGSGVVLYIACALIIPEKTEDDFVTVE